MNKLTITITIKEKFMLDWFVNYSTDEIAQEFLDDPEVWLDGAEIEVEKE